MEQQRIRDLVTGELTLDYFVRRSAEGWKVASVEWVRETATIDARIEKPQVFNASETAAVPYGLQIAADGQYLEENPLETTVLMLILKQIVKEKRISDIAIELNHAGHRTREGQAWNPTAVFNLLPRLIEAGPSLLKSAAWQENRAAGQKPQ